MLHNNLNPTKILNETRSSGKADHQLSFDTAQAAKE
jgi:hypothetical protein